MKKLNFRAKMRKKAQIKSKNRVINRVSKVIKEVSLKRMRNSKINNKKKIFLRNKNPKTLQKEAILQHSKKPK
jgi:hypothetical protein